MIYDESQMRMHVSSYIIVELKSEQLHGNSATKYALPTIW